MESTIPILDKETGLTLNNYKEPLTRVVSGFGYYGAILGTPDGEKIQCHICGQLYSSLAGHIYKGHKMDVRDYRETYQLAYGTALVSEAQREKLKVQMMTYLNSLSPKDRLAWKKRHAERLKIARTYRTTFQPKLSLESKNKRGVCPDQLLAKIIEVRDKLGYTPSLADFITETGGQRYKHIIFATFGSWKKAVEMAHLELKGPNQQKRRPVDYTDDELLEYLKIFYQENGKIPTHTDCKRRLIPNADSYKRHFGSLPNARELAGLPVFVGRWG